MAMFEAEALKPSVFVPSFVIPVSTQATSLLDADVGVSLASGNAPHSVDGLVRASCVVW